MRFHCVLSFRAAFRPPPSRAAGSDAPRTAYPPHHQGELLRAGGPRRCPERGIFRLCPLVVVAPPGGGVVVSGGVLPLSAF